MAFMRHKSMLIARFLLSALAACLFFSAPARAVQLASAYADATVCEMPCCQTEARAHEPAQTGSCCCETPPQPQDCTAQAVPDTGFRMVPARTAPVYHVPLLFGAAVDEHLLALQYRTGPPVDATPLYILNRALLI